MSARIELFPERADRDRYTAGPDSEPVLVTTDEPTGRWYWRLVGGNGETVCVSQAFTRKASAKRGARRAAMLMDEVGTRYALGSATPLEVDR